MPARLLLALGAALAVRCAAAQPPAHDADGNMQNLLAALAQGAPVVVYTPLANGLLQVTRFQPPVPLPRPQAEAAVAVARRQLALLDIPAPTPDQLARALAGGAIETRDGPQYLPGTLPLTGNPPTVVTYVVLPNGLPSVAAPVGAAAGATASPPMRRSP